MDFSKFNALSTETMLALRDHLNKVLETRVDTRPRIGKLCWFLNRDGVRVDGTITKLNHKTATVREIKPVAGRSYRVHYSILHVEETVKVTQPAVAAPPRVRHAPTTVGDAW